MNTIHTITAQWLDKKLNYSGEPRMFIKNNELLTWGKDQWGDEEPKR